MNNFDEEDRIAAAMILDHFVFISTTAVEAMLTATYRQLRNSIFSRMPNSAAIDYVNNMVFTSVAGEDPNVTDSGNLMCRKLRQVLALPDSRFVEPHEALNAAVSGKAVVFVDDFLGSGSQFLSSWRREYVKSGDRSFRHLFECGQLRTHYIVLIATQDGIDRLRSDIDGLAVTTAHVVDESLSVKALPWNPLLPDGFDPRIEIPAFLEKYSRELQLDHYLDNAECRKYGYNSSGLLLAFEHSTPDATIPLLWAQGSPNWTPLIRRT